MAVQAMNTFENKHFLICYRSLDKMNSLASEHFTLCVIWCEHKVIMVQYSQDPATATLEDDSLIGDNFLVGQVVASFLQVNNLAALALVQVTVITNPSSTSLPSINNDGMNNPAVKLSGQILQLKVHSEAWRWTGNWEIFQKASTAQSDIGSKNSAIILFPANLVVPISPQLVPDDTGVC